jgi:hypothetical protein
MNYLVLLYGDEAELNEPGTPEFDAEMADYERFGAAAGPAIVGGEALEDTSTATTIRSGGSSPLVTAGPFAETVEALGGFYVLTADGLDEAIDLARQIPAAATGSVEIRPVVEWFDRSATVERDPSTTRYLAVIHEKQGDDEVPGTAAWDEGAAEHARFGEAHSARLLAGAALQPVSTATTVRVRDGEVLVTDGPFAESAEVVVGFYVLWAADVDDAARVAAEIPVGPGGGVEVRPIMEIPG